MTVAVIGQGAWGQALVHLLNSAGQTMVPLHHDEALPAVPLAAVVLALPAQKVRESLPVLNIPAGIPLIIASKGIEQSTGLLMPEVAAAVLPHQPVYMLSGPSFAEKVLAGMPAALTLAGAGAEQYVSLFDSKQCRVYHSDDIIGVAVGGALKNVLAIGCGIAVGAGYGENARAALFTRGLAEIVRFGLALGARLDTFLGLSGVGDMVLTCTSMLSRNYAYGVGLGAQQPEGTHVLTEGVATASAALLRARRYQLDMPVTAAVAAILAGDISVNRAVQQLLERPGGKTE